MSESRYRPEWATEIDTFLDDTETKFRILVLAVAATNGPWFLLEDEKTVAIAETIARRVCEDKMTSCAYVAPSFRVRRNTVRLLREATSNFDGVRLLDDSDRRLTIAVPGRTEPVHVDALFSCGNMGRMRGLAPSVVICHHDLTCQETFRKDVLPLALMGAKIVVVCSRLSHVADRAELEKLAKVVEVV